LPKDLLEKEEAASKLLKAGATYEGQELANKYSLEKGQDLFAPPPVDQPKDDNVDKKEAKRKRKEERQRKRDEKERRRRAKEQKREKREERKREKQAQEMRKGKDAPSRKRRKKHLSKSADSDRSSSCRESE